MKWEYRLEKFKMDGFFNKAIDETSVIQALNSLGDMGWELISFEGQSIGFGETKEILAVLKRSKD